jgi:mono/diheme cytochrome c family protein
MSWPVPTRLRENQAGDIPPTCSSERNFLMINKFLFAPTLVTALGCGLIADLTPSRNLFPRPRPEGVTEQMIEQGRGIFHGRGGCFQCHGKNGTGTFFAPALNGERHIHLQTASYQEIIDLIRSGVPRPKRYLTAMPPLGGASLTDNEVRAVAAYVFTLAE